MYLVDRSVRGITRRVGPTRVGYLLARWAQKRYAGAWGDGHKDVIADHWDRGLRMRVDPTQHIGGSIYWRGCHSHRLLRCLGKLLTPDMTLFDVGANQGEVTLFAARRLTKGKVVAFEPVDENYRRLLGNAQLNGLTNIVAKQCCLGERAGRTQLFATPDESHLHRHGWNEGVSSMFAADERAVPFGHAEVHRLDDVVPLLALSRLDVLKIDVEGAELAVIRGGRESIARFRPAIIVEINDETFHCAGYTAADLSGELRSLDYDCYVINRSGNREHADGDKLPALGDTLWIPRRAAAERCNLT
jgi:FkbM family methyltransferase